MAQRIARPGQAEQTIQKSRFVALAEHCADERAVAVLLRRLAGEHTHANHLAFAYRIMGPQGCVQRFHDAGEPSGTAGKPIMQHVEGRGIVNACVAVVRYYGGINLGTGGLARAYGNTARLALEASLLQPFVEMQQIQLVLDYGRLDRFVSELASLDGQIVEKVFGEEVVMLVSVPVTEVERLQHRYG
jgi:uncharacterized YigZ family protein